MNYLYISDASHFLGTGNSPKEDASRKLVFDIFFPPLISLGGFYFVPKKSKGDSFNRIDPVSEFTRI